MTTTTLPPPHQKTKQRQALCWPPAQPVTNMFKYCTWLIGPTLLKISSKLSANSATQFPDHILNISTQNTPLSVWMPTPLLSVAMNVSHSRPETIYWYSHISGISALTRNACCTLSIPPCLFRWIRKKQKKRTVVSSKEIYWFSGAVLLVCYVYMYFATHKQKQSWLLKRRNVECGLYSLSEARFAQNWKNLNASDGL